MAPRCPGKRNAVCFRGFQSCNVLGAVSNTSGVAVRILIVADIEGVCGVTDPSETRPGGTEYERCRRLMTREVNCLAQGALDGGAREIWAVDSHGTYRNLIFEELHPDVRLISGKPRQEGMMAGMADHGPWHGVFLSGCHARAGSYGVLAHTINSRAFAAITVDGKAVGEAFLNSALAGAYDVPVRLVSGDDCVAREVASFLPEAEVVTVKQALANRAAVHLPLEQAREALRDSAEQAMHGDMTPLRLESPVWVEVQTVQPVLADSFALVPGVQRLYPTTVGFEAETPVLLLRMLNTFSAMSASVSS